MKYILILLSFICVEAGATSVRGYYRSNGTYVEPYQRSRADSNPYNNYSTRGSNNPYTGSRGYSNPYPSDRDMTPDFDNSDD